MEVHVPEANVQIHRIETDQDGIAPNSDGCVSRR